MSLNRERLICELFEDQVLKTPHHIALVFEEKRLTYLELNQRANQIAATIVNDYHVLHGQELSNETLIGIFVERGLDMIVGILAILKTGAGYVPIDIDFPDNRVRLIFNDTNIPIILTQQSLAERLNQIKSTSLHRIVLDEFLVPEVNNLFQRPAESSPHDLAYVIYTSGSTGAPKGVMITHQAIANFAIHQKEILKLTHHSKVLQFFSISFDVSVGEMFTALIAGCQLYIVPQWMKFDPKALSDYIAIHQITLAFLPPSVAILLKPKKLTSLNTMILGGEAFDARLLRRHFHPERRLFNAYGPTEATIITTLYQFKSKKDSPRIIGRSLPNTTTYVLDENQQPVKAGCVGELYIGGKGLASGYLNKPDLTNQIFIVDPFSPALDSRLYKTGDLVRLLPDGNMEYVGRRDLQIKIRGFRIELGEIEATLSTFSGMQHVVVQALALEKKQNLSLVAYYVSKKPFESDALRTHVSMQLPHYMIPNIFIHLSTLPMTANGKVDRLALPHPSHFFVAEKVAPNTIVEKELARIWTKVLGLESQVIYRDSDFFALGGHSLHTTQLAREILRQFKKQYPLKIFFQHSILSEFASFLQEDLYSEEKTTVYDQFSIEHDSKAQDDPFELSEVQQAYLIGRSENFENGGVGTHAYFELLFQSLDIKKLEAAWNRLIQHCPMLRVIFENNQQRCLVNVPQYLFKVQDCRELGSNVQQESILKWRNELSHQLFDPATYPLFEIRITKYHGGTLLHLSFDALMLDGASTVSLMRMWFELYQNPEKTLPNHSITFRDYQKTLTAIYQTAFYQMDKNYWLSRIPQLPIGPSLPINQSALPKKPHFLRLKSVIQPLLWDSLKKTARQKHVSLTSVISSLYGLVLAKWSGSSHFLINLTLFNRLPLHAEVNDILGDFTTLELLEFDGRTADDFNQLVREVHGRLWEDLEHRLFTGVAVQRELLRHHQLPFTRSLAPVVLTSLFGLEQESVFSDQLIKEFVKVNFSITQTPQVWLDNQIYEEKGALVIQWDYVEGILPAGMMEAMHSAYCELITYYAEHDWSRSIPRLIPSRDLELIQLANSQKQALPKQLLHEGFLQQATQSPDAIAIITSSRTLSYKDVDGFSAWVAHQLKGNEEPLIAIVMEKGWEEVVACLGILRNGQAYLPVNACWPLGRIGSVLKEGKVKTVITQSWVLKTRSILKRYHCIVVDSNASSLDLDFALSREIAANALAYVIFTSGSTGVPKGVAISHQSAMNTIKAVNKAFDVGRSDRVLALSDFSFDLSVYDMFGLLSAGGAVVIPDADKIKDPRHWVELLERHRVTFWNSVPTFLNMLMDDHVSSDKVFSTIKTVFLSGDWIAPGRLSKMRHYMPHARLMSLGGATEAAIWSVWYDMTDLREDMNYVPYGFAMPNQQLWILNEQMECCPLGVPGQIYIGGVGLAIEYWGDKKRTSASFIIHPKTHDRLYRTGDLGVWHSAGGIQFLGRIDTQVKIAGHRVELGEIEYYLKQIDSVSDAIVLLVQDGNVSRLVAYLQSENVLQQEEITDILSHQLSNYMIPDCYVMLKRYPLSAQGKVDRNALLQMRQENTSHQSHIMPHTHVEKVLCDLYSNILKVTDIGCEAHFFQLGGDSLLAVHLSYDITKNLQIDCPTKIIFDYPVLKNLAYYLENKLKSQIDNTLYEHYSIMPDLDKQYEPFLLSEVQQAYLIGRSESFEGSGVGTHSYFELLFESLDVAKLEHAWNRLVKHHAMLRVVFEGSKQRCLATVPAYSFRQQDCRKLKPSLQQEKLLQWRKELSHQLFDPSCYPLFDIRITRYEKGVVLHLSLDALMLDGASMLQLIRTWFELYRGTQIRLKPLSITFRDYQQTLLSISQSTFYQADQAYWLKRISQLPFGPELPINQVVLSKATRFKRLTKRMKQSHWSVFKTNVQERKLSLTSVLCSLYGLVLAKWSGSSHFLINLTLFNRLPLHAEVNDILGDFTTLELLEFDARTTDDFNQLVREVHGRLWEDLEHRLFTGVAVQRELLRHHQLPFTRSLAPVVLTSLFGLEQESVFSDQLIKEFVKVNFSITQTPQVWLDNQIYEEKGALVIQWDYVDGILPAGMMEAMHSAYCELITYYAEHDWSRPIPRLIPSKELELIRQANSQKQALPKQLLHEGFLQQATQSPDAIAIITSSRTLSYKDVDGFSAWVAHQLKGNEEPLVAIVMEKGWEEVIACLGILRNGQAYLPINACWPLGRISTILKEGKVKTVVTQSWVLKTRDVFNEYHCIVVDSKAPSPCLDFSSSKKIVANALAYVIFTSGSTGVPKGVAISHQSAMNTIKAVNQAFRVGHTDRVLALSDFSFDLSVYDMFGLLSAGGAVVIPDADKIKDPRHWVEMIENHCVSFWNSVPTFLNMLMDDHVSSDKVFSTIKTVFLSGDWIVPGRLSKMRHYMPHARLMSLGGATEAAIWSVWYDMTDLGDDMSYVPYGFAMPNQQLWILNEQMECCPLGVPGQIYIGGVGLAIEYWGDKKRTSTSFIIHPKTHDRLYRTGDLGVWHSAGGIQFLGRIDTQVKIAGHRVELGEIEQVIENLPGILNCMVEYYLEPTPSLAAYISYNKTEPSPILRRVLNSFCVDTPSRLKTFNFAITEEIPQDEDIANITVDQLNTLYVNAILKLFADLNLFTTPKTIHSIPEILEATGILFRYEKWLRRALETLVSLGYLKKDAIYYTNEHALPKTKQDVFDSFKNIEIVQTILSNALSLRSILSSYQSAELYIEHFNTAFYQRSLGNEYALVTRLLQCLFLNRSQPVVILEVGAGTGSLADEILKICYLEQDRYIFTDISNYFLNNITTTYPNHPNLICQLYNLDEDPQLQGLKLNSIDFIIANEVLHDVKSVRKTMSHLTTLLKPGGLLLLLEETHFHPFTDIMHGFISGFERFEDSDLRAMHPYLSKEQWTQVSLEADFELLNWAKPCANTEQVFSTMGIGLFMKSQHPMYQLDITKVQQRLAEQLSDYMIPKEIIVLDQLPLSAQGKVDRKALPRLKQDTQLKDNAYFAPKNHIEKTLCILFENFLKQSPIGCDHHFFQMGGDSLLAVQLGHEISKVLSIECPTKAIFDFPVLKDLAHYLGEQGNASLPKIDRIDRRRPIVLSHAQERLWFLDKYAEGQDSSYVMGAVFSLKGTLDIEALESSIAYLMTRHEGLRTTFIEKQGIAYQVFLPASHYRLKQESLSKKALQGKLDLIIKQALNLSEGRHSLPSPTSGRREQVVGGLTEWYLFKVSSTEHVLMIKLHHVISDGWSLEHLFRELSDCYAAYTLGKKPKLKKLPFQYADFAVWQRKWIKESILKQQEEYWRQTLADVPVLELPLDYPRPAILNPEGSSTTFSLNPRLVASLRTIAQEEDVTLFIVLLTGLSILLMRYSEQKDFVIGAASSGRGYSGVEDIQGFFVNTLPLRQRFASEETIQSLLQKTKEMFLQGFEHQEIPFEYLVNQLHIERDPSRHPLVQVMVSQIPWSHDFALSGLKVDALSMQSHSAKFDLSFFFREKNNQVEIAIEYNTSLFSEATVSRIQSHLTLIYEQCIETHSSVYQLDLITKKEKQLLAQWNATDVVYPKNETIHQLFEEQAQRFPNHIALTYEDQQLTYQQLNDRANQLAHYLRSTAKIQPDTLIVIFVERSLEMIISILAILKAGGAYVPIDPEYPDTRIQYILDDTKASLILTQRHLRQRLKSDATLIDTEKSFSRYPKTNLQYQAKPHDLAYVIYTSGSTGKPKGVMIEHRSVMNLVYEQKERYLLDDKARILQFASICFDIAVWEIFSALLVGARLFIVSDSTKKDAAILGNYIEEQGITIGVLPPSLGALLDNIKLKNMNQLIFAGEALQGQLLRKYFRGKDTLINEYGPTEATVFSTMYAYENATELPQNIGKALRNIKLYVLSDANTMSPIGTKGELYIGGAGLARGYLNRPELTKERFIENVFATEEDKKNGYTRLYKTGDLVRWLSDGNLEYIGRNDFQVKLRGYRIELGEIEAALNLIQGINHSLVVVAEKDEQKRIVAYIVRQDKLTEAQDIERQLKHQLPQYMLPSQYIFLESFSLTVNGKIDRKALPKPEENVCGRQALSTETEITLGNIWREMLGLSQEKLYQESHFFELGGHSLNAVRVSVTIQEIFHVHCPVKTLFAYPQLKALGSYIDGQKQTHLPEITSIKRNQIIPLSHSQERLWFLDKYAEGQDSSYVMGAVFSLKGKLDIKALENSIAYLMTRHEGLRATFIEKQGIANQVFLPASHYRLKQERLGKKELQGKLDLIIKQALNLSEGGLTEWYLFKVSSTEHVLMIKLHHIISDGWSLEHLLQELSDCYAAYTSGKKPKLKKLPFQYADFAVWQRKWIKESILKQQEEYWREALADVPVLELPLDYPRPAILKPEGSSVTFSLNPRLVESLRTIAQEEDVTLFIVLLTGLSILLMRYTEQKDFVIGAASSGREYSGVEDIQGFFVNTLPLRQRFSSEETIKSLLQKTKETFLQGFDHQEVPFEYLVNQLQIERDPSRHPLVQVMVSQIPWSRDFALSGLKVDALSMQSHSAKFDLSFFFREKLDQAEITIEYNTNLFNEATISRIQSHLTLIYEQCIETHSSVYQLDLITKKEKQLLAQWNTTDIAYPRNETIHQLFEEQAQNNPKHIALTYEEHHVTYGELNQKANQLAHYIRAKAKIQHDTLIVICVERSIDMIVGILAILKAGGAYVPIDPEYPDTRIQYILNDTKATLILTQSHLQERFQHDCIAIDEIEHYVVYPSNNVSHTVSPHDLAYVIYTSGSTGEPKGVLQTHENVCHLLRSTERYFDFNEKDVWTLFHSYTFDFSIWEIFGAYCYGGRVVIVSDKCRRDVELFHHLIRQQGVTVLNQTPMVFSQLIEVDRSQKKLTTLRYVIFGGEALHVSILKSWYDRYPAAAPKLINMYGITEITVHATYCALNPTSILNGRSMIGRPLPHLRAYVLSKEMTLCPIGIKGELYISGIGLARGYLNRTELTKERFINNPFATEEDKKNGYARLYKTGDVVRWHPDGNVEYIGRNDFQVKLRGYRIELGEIESALNEYPGIQQVVASIQTSEQQNRYLLAHYVSPKPIETERLRTFLEGRLLNYMIPSQYVHITKIPLTPNGKVDRKALPKAIASMSGRIIPRTTLELQLSKIWEMTLGIKGIGIRDDFFRLGGDSIVSIQLISKMRQAGFNCLVKDIFQYRTIESFAGYLESGKKRKAIIAEQGLLKGSFELLPIQRWFFNQAFCVPNHFNQSFMVRVPTLNRKRLEESVSQLVAHHDALRLRFKKKATQTYYSKIPAYSIRYLKQASHEILTELQSHFDIVNGPLWQIAYIEEDNATEGRIFFALHHLIVDTVSWRILVEDLRALYEGKPLAAKTSSYREWVDWIERYQKQKGYWKAAQNDWGYPKPKQRNQPEQIAFDASLTDNLLHHIHDAYHTEINDVLLTALAYSLNACFSTSNPAITLEGHGREVIDERIDVSRTVGWFTTMFPVILPLKTTSTNSLKAIKEALRQIPNKGIGYSVEDTSSLPPIVFNYLGQFETQKEYDDWMIVPEDSGLLIAAQNEDHCLISMNGFVIEGKLQFQVTGHIEPETLRLFVTTFTKELMVIVEDCIQAIKTGRVEYTPSDFKGITITDNLLSHLQNAHPFSHIMNANSLQQGFIYHALRQPDDDAYRVQLLIRYHGVLHVQALKQAWLAAFKKYPGLRLYFNWEDAIIQVIAKEVISNWNVYDIRNERDKIAALQHVQETDRKIPFDLTKPPLIRVSLIQESQSSWVMMITNHHSVLDGWSTSILVNYIQQSYARICNNETVDVIEDLTYELSQAYIATHQAASNRYWKKNIQWVDANDIHPMLDHRVDLESLRSIKNPLSLDYTLEKSLLQALQEAAKRVGVTLNVIIQFAWHKLLQRYTGDKITVVGTTISGRTLPINGIEDSVGLHINTLPLIIDWDNTYTVEEQLNVIHEKMVMMNEYSAVSLATIQREGRRLFHSLLVYENYPIPEGLKDKQTPWEMIDIVEKVDYPLSLLIGEDSEGVTLKLKYAGEYIQQDKATQYLSQLRLILEQIPQKLHEPTHRLDLVTEKEKQLLAQWNATDVSYPLNKTIPELFEEQTKRFPNHIAVTYDDQHLTYQQLNEQANQLAHYLRSSAEIKPDTLIAIFVERSLEMIVGILGILKAGGAYVPIDPEYPDTRIQYILDDTKASLILTQRHLRQRLKSDAILIDTAKAFSRYPKTNPQYQVNPHDLAYVIYTSGSTGKPKGVMIEHRSVMNVMYEQNERCLLDDKARMLQFASICFDVAAWEIFSTLLAGARLFIVSESTRKDPRAFMEYIEQQAITIALLPPSLALLLDYNKIKHMKTLLFGGEASSHELLRKSFTIDNCKRLNAYGPTETTMYCCMHEFNSASESPLTIGKGLSNVKLYVVSDEKTLSPIGSKGELYVGGIGLARGYLNRPEITKERFIENPWATEEDKQKGYTTLYKTGDIVRWLPNGNLEYINRNDFQVKIHGYRIELKEIEMMILTDSNVQQCIVLANEMGDRQEKQLIAYIVPESTDWQSESLRSFLQENLPRYMIPHRFITLQKMPLTINNKIDRDKLLELVSKENHTSLEVLITRTELHMASLWKDVLKLKVSPSPTASFYELGGTSLSVMALLGKINTAYKCNFSLQTLLENFTIRALSEKIDKGIKTTWSPLIALNTQDSDKPDLYIIPGAIGCASAYYPLGALLSEKFAVKLFEIRGLYNGDDPYKHLDELLVDYYSVIKKTKNKPLYILAHSMGAIYGYELTDKLRKAGYDQVKLIVLDGLTQQVNSVEEAIGTTDTDTDLLSAIKILYGRSSLEGKFNHEKASTLQQIADYLFSDDAIDKEYALKVAKGFSNVFRSQVDIGIQYQFKQQYQGDLIYLYAENILNLKEKMTRMKQRFLGKVTSYQVPGDHLSMLAKENVAWLAKRILML